MISQGVLRVVLAIQHDGIDMLMLDFLPREV